MDTYIEISKAQDLGIPVTKELLEYANSLKKEYEIFAPFGKLVPLVEVRYYDKKYHYHGFIITMRYNNILMQPVKTKNQYYFVLPNPYRHRHLEYFKSKLTAPNKIGKPTAKKIEDWFFYLTMKECEQKDCVRLHTEKEDALKIRLKKLGSLVVWENEHTAKIEKNNLCYTIYFRGGSINNEIKIIKQYSVTLDDFLTMINYEPNENIS